MTINIKVINITLIAIIVVKTTTRVVLSLISYIRSLNAAYKSIY
jgi:hypothetical protein